MAKKKKNQEGTGFFPSPLYSAGSTSRGLSPETLETVGPVAGPKGGKDTPDPIGHLKGGKK